MGYKRYEFDSTKLVKSKGNIFTGSNDAIFLRNKYQPLLDNAYGAAMDEVHFLEEKSNLSKELFNKAQGLKRNIDAHLEERHNLYESLERQLKEELGHEYKMWEKTRQNVTTTKMDIKQKFNDSDVEEIRFDSMLEYLKQYPEYASKSTFKFNLDEIKNKEQEIRKERQYYNEKVSAYNYELSTWPKEIQKASDKFEEYEKILKLSQEKLANTRYIQSIFYKLASEEKRAEVNVDTLHHRIKQFRNTLDVIKNEYAQYQANPLIEMKY